MDIKTDFPYVKSYGKQADDDYKYVDVGDDILLDGCIQTREYDKILECDCGAKTKYKDTSLEIVPYQTEYFINRTNIDKIKEDNEKLSDTENTESIADKILS